jgi:hypothetical protein
MPLVSGGLPLAVLIGVLAVLLPAVCARLSPTEALWAV